MKWQNILVKRCPKCEAPLEKEEKKEVFLCTKCNFIVTGRKVLAMIEDPASPLRRFEHPDTPEFIRNQIAQLT